MKDKDIIQALRVCVDTEPSCNECSLHGQPNCIRNSRICAADRLEELKRENKRLKKKNKRLKGVKE